MPAINKQVQQKPAKPALNLIQAKRQVLKTMVGQTLKEDRILELARNGNEGGNGNGGGNGEGHASKSYKQN